MMRWIYLTEVDMQMRLFYLCRLPFRVLQVHKHVLG